MHAAHVPWRCASAACCPAACTVSTFLEFENHVFRQVLAKPASTWAWQYSCSALRRRRRRKGAGCRCSPSSPPAASPFHSYTDAESFRRGDSIWAHGTACGMQVRSPQGSFWRLGCVRCRCAARQTAALRRAEHAREHDEVIDSHVRSNASSIKCQEPTEAPRTAAPAQPTQHTCSMRSAPLPLTLLALPRLLPHFTAAALLTSLLRSLQLLPGSPATSGSERR